MRRRKRKKVPPAERQPLLRPAAANEVWSIDFVFDRTAELGRLSEDHPTRTTLSRADVFEHPQPPRHAVPRGSHPRNVRVLPPSRDFH